MSLSLASLSQQQASVAPATKSDYSQEAAILEEMATKVVFQDDGKFTRQQTSRVRILSDTGVKDWGLLSLPYQSATQTVEVDYVRVRKPDGSTVATPSDNVQDLDSEITRAAPFYSDLREKHIAVKGLGKGDTLEYAVHWQSTKALVPGQFWFQYNFHREGIVLSERLEIQVPSNRAVKVKGPQTQTLTTEGSSQVYTWTYSKLQNTNDAGEEEKKAADGARGRLPQPDVQISTFQTWNDVGRWYWDLQKDRVEPSPAVRAKAAELTKGLTDDEAKLRAIYSFVSTQYRYIGIAFGVGRYQPHAADDVLSNNYGDCKDKHTLLTSLLRAVGISIYPALINSSRVLDDDVPSPAQFDHVIGYLPHGKGKEGVWLDTTPEVAALGFLLPILRGKEALVISGDDSTKMVPTPVDPPFPGSQNFTIEGTLQDDGTFQAKVEDTVRGENEVYLRAAFRAVPQSQWKDLVQQISYQLGYAGTVSDVTASVPEAVNEPFHFAYSYNRKNYPDWSNQRFTIPGLPFAMPPVRDDSKYPVWLGSAVETISKSKVEVPRGYIPRVPDNVDLKYDFAEYQASYSLERGLLKATRKLVIKQHEVPVTEFAHYRQFLKDVSDDINQYVLATPSAQAGSFPGAVSESGGSPAPSSTVADRMAAFQERLRSLPDSASPDARKLEADAREQISKHDVPGAVSSLYRAVGADVKFARAWVLLGSLLLMQREKEAGTEAFRKAMSAAPGEAAIPKALGYALMANADFDAAVPVWQDVMKAHPDDVDGPTNLGNCLRRLNRNSEAAAAYETALKIESNQPAVQMSLGSTYLQAGDRQKASAAFQKLAEVDSEKRYLNDAAYEMANSDLDLTTALSFAKQAVRAAEDNSDKIRLPELTVENLGRIFRLAAYWDTLGWVYERTSNMPAAEEYLRASWKLNQDGVVAGHLCHMYRREHRTALAVQMCKLAISRMSMSKHLSSTNQFSTELAAANENLHFLTGHDVRSTDAFDTSSTTNAERTYKLPRFLPGTQSAEFFLLFASDGKSKKFKVEDVKFISGSDKMKGQERLLKTIDFNVPAPGNARTRFVWRGILGCYQYTGCSFVVLDPTSVRSLN